MSWYFLVYISNRMLYYIIMKSSLLLYETHVPQKGFTKIWPTDVKCPVCNFNIIARPGSHKPLYIPNRHSEGGERVVIYVCTTCYLTLKHTTAVTVEELIEEYKCHMELKNHLKSILRGEG